MTDPEYERAIVHTPGPDDVVVIEVGHELSPEACERLVEQANKVFGPARVVVLSDAHFAGVVRNEAVPS